MPYCAVQFHARRRFGIFATSVVNRRGRKESENTCWVKNVLASVPSMNYKVELGADFRERKDHQIRYM